MPDVSHAPKGAAVPIIRPKIGSISIPHYPFDRALVLYSQNTILENVLTLLSTGTSSWLISNDESARELLKFDPANRKRVLAGIRSVFCSHNFLLEHAKVSDIELRTLDSPLLTSLFPGGNTHLLQRSISLARGQNSKEIVIGSDMYLGAGLFAPEAPLQGATLFRISTALATHGAFLNFTSTKAAWLAGWVVGDQQFLSVMNLSLEEYSPSLDCNLGEGRRL